VTGLDDFDRRRILSKRRTLVSGIDATVVTMSTRTSDLAMVVFFVVALAGCESSEEKFKKRVAAIGKKHHGLLTTQLAGLKAAQQAARVRPYLRPVETKLPSDGRALLLGDTSVLMDDAGSPPGNGCHFITNRVNSHFELLKQGMPPWNEFKSDDELEEQLFEAIRMDYVVVCQQTAAQAPVATSATTFVGGRYRGECRLFTVKDATYLGGYEISSSALGGSGAANGSVEAIAMESLSEWTFSDIKDKFEPLKVIGGVDCDWR
jgi:hypothetical protein